MIKQGSSLQELSDVVNVWASSFDSINASAAFVRAAQLAGNRQASGRQQELLAALLSKLSIIWASVILAARAWQLSFVLWACSKLRYHNGELWSSTLAAFSSQVERANCQELCNVAFALAVVACANRGSVPGCTREEVLQAMQAIVGPVYVHMTNPQLGDITAQHLVTLSWACDNLYSKEYRRSIIAGLVSSAR